MAGRLVSKVALVSGGAGQGIGSAVSTRMAEEGAAVMISDVDDERGNELVDSLVSRGLRAAYVHADVTSATDQRDAVDATVSSFGRLDVVNAHAIGRYTRDYISSLTTGQWDDGITAVLSSAFYLAHAALTQMLKTGGGSIVLTASAAGFGSQRGTPIYSVGKSAVMTLAKCIANEYGTSNIRCNAIAPGITGHGAAESVKRTAYSTLAEFTAQHALRRLIETQEVANLVVFLASDESSAITGTVIPVDAGYSAGFGDFQGRPPFRERLSVG